MFRKRRMVILLLFLLWLNNSSFLYGRVVSDTETQTRLIAHRGVHQIYKGDNRSNDTCRAENVEPIQHAFIENTLPSIRAALSYGADVVELDVHLTIDDQFAVYHDWRLDCQTDGEGVTHKQSFDYLRTLDLGYDFTTDGITFPLRGSAIGEIPSLKDVLDARLSGQILINFKSNRKKDGTYLVEQFSESMTPAKVFGVYGGGKPTRAAIAAMPWLKGFDKAALKSCLIRYFLVGWSGFIPQACKNRLIAVPINYAPALWGWPHKFTARMKGVNTSVILWGAYDGSGFSSGIDSVQALADVPTGFDGYVWTNKIEIIGPLLKKVDSGS